MDLPEILDQTMGEPGKLRFILQPAIALILGLGDGRNDAMLGRAPYLLALLTSKGERLDRLKRGAARSSRGIPVARRRRRLRGTPR